MSDELSLAKASQEPRRRSWCDKPHTLVITEPNDGLEPAREWRVAHPPTCSWEAYRALFSDADPFGSDPDARHHFHRSCLTQYELDHVGIDSIDGWEKLTPGRYEIVAESIYYAGEFGGTWGEEWDVILSLASLDVVEDAS